MAFFLTTFIKNIAQKIGAAVSHLFKNANAAWKKLNPELQEALLKGSGLVATINEHLDKTPAFVYELIENQFPGVSKEKIAGILAEAAKGLNIATDLNDADAVALLGKIQTYLNSLQGKGWAIASDTLAKIVAIFLAPPGTKFAAVASFITFVYHRFIKKDNA